MNTNQSNVITDFAACATANDADARAYAADAADAVAVSAAADDKRKLSNYIKTN